MSLHLTSITIDANGGPTKATLTKATPCRQITVQNNAGHTARVGGKNTSSTRGIALAASGAANSIVTFGPFSSADINLEDVWVTGTAADVIDIAYVQN